MNIRKNPLSVNPLSVNPPMSKISKITVAALATLLSLPAAAGRDVASYIDWGTKGVAFGSRLLEWEPGQPWSEDDNFFISRVRPHLRFTNRATQINPDLDETNDKNLIFWVPVNREGHNALPDARFDSEVFPFWSYVTHYGNWSAPLARVPGAFLDAAHRNGVAVSAVASIPYGQLTAPWQECLEAMIEGKACRLADYLLYYGIDGIGYNSEFSSRPSMVGKLSALNVETMELMREAGNPRTEFIWYDGTNSSGQITFDRGLGAHNSSIFRSDGKDGASLFLNYNWNDPSLLSASVEEAAKAGRSSLNLYCGINMQGREPHNGNPQIWTLLKDYPLSIGLWGAHSENMFFESRAESGSTPERRQRTYLNRLARWFSGGDANPLTAPEINNSLVYSEAGEPFFGMSSMMSARSALKWDLAEEPFITNFNLGNGRFFNWEGSRSNDTEWYNIGVQDYLPTWLWWFADSFLGHCLSKDSNRMKAEFVWDDAWAGGSCLRIAGDADEVYLHLFKTEFGLKRDDRISFRSKTLAGSADMELVLSFKGRENEPVRIRIPGEGREKGWKETEFIVGKDIEVPEGAEVAIVAIRFSEAEGLDMRVGELAMVRPGEMKPELPAPVLGKSLLLYAGKEGADGKLIFSVASDTEPVGKKIYNSDLNISCFKLYAQQEGGSPVLMGMTTSWGALILGAPLSELLPDRVRFGVSSLSLDRTRESEISWSDYEQFGSLYQTDESLYIDQPSPAVNHAFEIGFEDRFHPAADWRIVDGNGVTVASAEGMTRFVVEKGLPQAGSYDMCVITDGEERLLRGYIRIVSDEVGHAPRILDYSVVGAGQERRIDYRADFGEGILSRAVAVGEGGGVGFPYMETGLKKGEPFSIGFWFRPDTFESEDSHLFSIRDKSSRWAINNWGWCWHTLGASGRPGQFSVRTDKGTAATYNVSDMKLYSGSWHHLSYVFDYDDSGRLVPAIYCDGRKALLTPTEDFPAAGDPITGHWNEWGKETMVEVGGYLHKCGSVNGRVDNLTVWNKALPADEISVAMGEIEVSELPDGLLGFFTFDDEPDEENRFAGVGEAGIRCGTLTYRDTEVEGQGTVQWVQPRYRGGAPGLKGEYRIMTRVNADVEEGELLDLSRDNEGGSVTIGCPDADGAITGDGDGPSRPVLVHLRLENEYGEDVREIELMPEGGEGVVEEPVSESAGLIATPSLFEETLSVEVSESGDYSLLLYDMKGSCRLSNHFSAELPQTLRIYPQVEPGPYILLLEKEGHPAAYCRVIRK